MQPHQAGETAMEPYELHISPPVYRRVLLAQMQVRRQTALVAAQAHQGQDTTVAQQTLDALLASLDLLWRIWVLEVRFQQSMLGSAVNR